MPRKKYWLLKSEPKVYSIHDLKRDRKTCWEGVRNYQARNFIRDDMSVGDLVLFYHSSAEPPGVAGIAKISKSLRNVVSPDDVVAEFGADAFRMYEMYMGPIEASKPWNTRDVPGLFRLLNRIWRLVVDENTDELSPALVDEAPSDELNRMLHKTIKKVSADIEAFKFNTAIGQIFDFVNLATPLEKRPRSVKNLRRSASLS